MRHAWLSILIIGFLVGCAPTGDQVGQDTDSSEGQGEARAIANYVQTKVTADSGLELAALLEAESEDATRQNLQPYVYFSAEWCGPCKAIKKHMKHRDMQDAFHGTYIIEADVDEWTGDRAMVDFDVSSIPRYYRLTSEGENTGSMIGGDAWGDNIPENMAPPLKAFFQVN